MFRRPVPSASRARSSGPCWFADSNLMVARVRQLSSAAVRRTQTAPQSLPQPGIRRLLPLEPRRPLLVTRLTPSDDCLTNRKNRIQWNPSVMVTLAPSNQIGSHRWAGCQRWLLAELGIAPLVGSGGDSYDLAEAVNAAGKTELITRGKPGRCIDGVQLSTAERVAWYNQERLHETSAKFHQPRRRAARVYAATSGWLSARSRCVHRDNATHGFDTRRPRRQHRRCARSVARRTSSR